MMNNIKKTYIVDVIILSQNNTNRVIGQINFILLPLYFSDTRII